MRGSVDSRVVEMHFDNKDFMDKISETIAALEELNKQIASINGTNGLDNIAKNVNGADLSNVADAVGNIENRFSTLGIVGMTILQRLTNAGIDMAMKIGNGIKAVGNQITSGGFIRAEKLEQAKFLLEGLGADVEAVMDRVNEAVDGTAYGLDEAAKASASFFASGIKDMDQMEATLKSVSGVAALVGSDYSSIAEIFTTVAGQGKLMTMQLRQLESRGLNAAAYLAEYFGTTEEAVREMVTQGKVSFEDFTAAMSRFAEHAKDANKTFSGSLANMKTALSRLGEAFITPAMEAAIPVFNGLREAISAFTTELKTNLPHSDGLVTTFANSVDYLGNKIGVLFRLLNGKTFSEDEIHNLSEKGYGDLAKLARAARSTHSIFADFGHSIGNIGKMLITAFNQIGSAFKEVFPKVNLENFKSFMMSFNAAVSNFYLAHKNMEGFKNVMVGVFSLMKAGYNIISGVVKVLVAFVKAITGVVSKTGSLSEGFMNISKSLSNLTGAVGIFDLLASAIEGAGKVIGKALNTIFEALSKFSSSMSSAVGGIENINDALSMLGIIWASLFGGQLITKVSFMGTKILQLFTGVKDVLNTFMRTAANFPDKFNTLMTTLTNSLNNMAAEVQSKAIKNIALSVLALAIALKILEGIDNADLARGLSSVTVILAEMTAVMAILTKIAGGGEFAKSLKGIYAMNSVTTALIKIGAAMILMAVALKMISSIEPKQLAAGLAGLTIMLGAVLGFVIALDKFQTMKMDTKVGATLMGVAAALLIMSKAIQTLSLLKPTELAKGLSAVVIVLGAIFGFVAASSKMGVSSSAGLIAAGVGMIAIATAINILAPALKTLGTMKLESLAKGLSAVAIAMVSMSAVSQFADLKGAAAILVISVALASLGTTIERLGSLDITTIAKGLGTIIGAIVALGVASALLAPATAAMLALGGAMMLVSASIAVFGAGLIMIGAGLTSISAGIMSFASVTSTSLGIFVNTIKMMFESLISLIPSLAAALAEGLVTFLEQIASLSSRFKDAISEIISNALAIFDKNAPKIIKSGLRFILNFLEGLEEAMPQIAKKAGVVIAGFIEGISQSMDKIVQAGFNLVINFINGLANGIRENAPLVRDAIWNLCTAILDAFMSFFGIHSPSTVMEQQGVNLIQGLINGITSLGGTVGSYLISAVKSGFATISKWGSKFRTSGATLIRNLASGIKSGASNVANFVRSAVTSAWNAVKSFSSKFATAGLNLIKGVANGIRNGASHLISATGSMASKALNHFKSKLGISSPSKVFAEAARWIPEGIVVGINKTSNKVSAAVSSMANNTVDAMTEAVARAYEALDANDDFSPTITPVLDLSEVKKEAGGINSILGNNSISAAYSTQNASDMYQTNNMNRLMEMLSAQIGRLADSESSNNKTVPMTNYINVDGAENPEDFANRLIRRFAMEMRAG